MSYLKNILAEERDRLRMLEKAYQDQLAGLPRGCISVKQRKGLEYLYVAYRKSGKVTFDYIGPCLSAKSQAIVQQIEKKDALKIKLKQVRSDLRDIERALGAKQI